MIHLETVLITGASRGIGLATGHALARAERRGPLRLVLCGRQAKPLEEAARDLQQSSTGTGLEVVPRVMDVTSGESVREGIAHCRAAFGGVDGLVLNAGVAESAPLHRTSDELYERLMRTNVDGVFRPMREALPDMLARGRGRVVVVGSIASKIGAPYIAAYCASKHAVLGLVRAAAVEYAAQGITVNAVCPGYVDTPMTQRTLARIAEKTSLDEAGARQRLEQRSPQGRLYTAAEVAHAICFLLSEEAAGINGSTLDVDGGEMAG